MKTIIFKNEMDWENIDALIAEIEIISENETTTNIKYLDENGKEFELEQYIRKIYFSTAGGIISTSKILVDYINNNELFYFIFIVNDELSSAGFDTFIRLKCERKVLDGSFSIIHTITSSIDVRENRKKDSIQKELLKTLENDIAEQIKYYRNIGIDEKKIKSILNGNDAFLNKQELENLILK